MFELLERLFTLATSCKKIVVRGDGGELRLYVTPNRVWAEGGIVVVVDGDGVEWFEPRDVEVMETPCGKESEWVDIMILGRDGDETIGHEVYGVWLEARRSEDGVAASIRVKRRYQYLVDDAYVARRREAIGAGMKALEAYLRAALEALSA